MRDALIFHSIPHLPPHSPVTAVMSMLDQPMTSVTAERRKKEAVIRDRRHRCRPASVAILRAERIKFSLQRLTIACVRRAYDDGLDDPTHASKKEREKHENHCA